MFFSCEGTLFWNFGTKYTVNPGELSQIPPFCSTSEELLRGKYLPCSLDDLFDGDLSKAFIVVETIRRVATLAFDGTPENLVAGAEWNPASRIIDRRKYRNAPDADSSSEMHRARVVPEI